MEDRLFALVKIKLEEVDQKIEDLFIVRGNLRQYYDDLSKRLASGKNEKREPADTNPCQCFGEKTDILQD